MILDTSAVVAVLRQEAGWEDLLQRMLSAPVLRISAGTLLECRIVAERDAGAAELAAFMEKLAVETVPTDARQIDIALAGYRTYGKGRHPAGLNFGDCFAYALSKILGESLLFKGDDFSRTDIEPA